MLNKKIYKALCIYLLLSFCFSSILNAQVLIKLATITPDNSPWNDTLYAGAERVEKLTNGRVRIRIYGNGLAGGEREVLRKIRLGSVEAGVFSALALKSLVPGTLVMTLPYFVRTEKQLQRVLDELTPEFNSTFATKGYEVLGWAFSGWIHMFYKNDIRSPEQVGNVRLGVDPSEAELQAAWQRFSGNSCLSFGHFYCSSEWSCYGILFHSHWSLGLPMVCIYALYDPFKSGSTIRCSPRLRKNMAPD